MQAGNPLQTQPADFRNMYAQAVQAKQARAMQAAQLQSAQQQQQMGQMQMQAAQQAQEDEQKARALYAGGAKPTDEQLYAAVGPKSASAIIESRLKAEKAVKEGQKTDAEIAEKGSLRANHAANFMGHLAFGVKQAGYSQVAIADAIRTASEAGYGQQAQQLQQALAQQPDMLPQLLDQAISRSPEVQTQLREESDKQSLAEQRKEQAGTAKTRLQIEQQNADTQARNSAQSLQQGNARLALEARRVGYEGQRVGMEGKRLQQQAIQADPISALSPSELEQAQLMATGEKKLLPQSARTGRNKIINDAAYTIAQQNGVPLSDTLYKTHQDFTSSTGQANQRMKSITRVMGHLEDFDANNQKLGTSYLDMVGVHGKTPNQVNLNKDATAISEEWKTLIKGNSSLAAHTELLQGLESPYQKVRQGAANEIKSLLSEQFRGDYQAYKAGTGRELPVDRIFDAKTQQRLSKEGYLPNQMNPQGAPPQGAGGVPTVGSVLPNGEKVLKVVKKK
jgi:hypothetical protein